MKKGWGQATGQGWCFCVPFSAPTLLVGLQKGFVAHKKLCLTQYLCKLTKFHNIWACSGSSSQQNNIIHLAS